MRAATKTVAAKDLRNISKMFDVRREEMDSPTIPSSVFTSISGGALDAPPVLSWTLSGKWPGKPPIQKVVDETTYLKRPRRGAKLIEEVWQDEGGEVVRYSLAYVNPSLCGTDNGRVLGYDNSHRHHHRHFMGRQEPFEFAGYESLATRFYKEVRELWRKEDEERRKCR
jgi:hypothetical protein